MPLSESRYRRVQIEIAALLGVVIVLVVGFFLFMLHEWDARRQETLRVRYGLCALMNQDRASDRADAWKTFNDLSNTLRLLRLPPTPEIVAKAKETRDRKLARARALDCDAFAHAKPLDEILRRD